MLIRVGYGKVLIIDIVDVTIRNKPTCPLQKNLAELFARFFVVIGQHVCDVFWRSSVV